MDRCRRAYVKISVVAEAVSYTELSVAAKSEEQYQAKWKRRQQYRQAEQMKQDARPSQPSVSVLRDDGI